MPPVVIAAGIGAAGAIGGGLLASSAQKKAANKASDTARDTASMNNALQRDIYGKNTALLNPYVQRGNEAGNAINALLGIAGTAPAQPAPIAPAQGAQQYGAPAPAGNYTSERLQRLAPYRAILEQRDGVEATDRLFAEQPQAAPQTMAPTATAAPAVASGGAGVTPYQNAFQNYLGSTGYQFQMDQGNQAINQGYAAKGSLQSGAALKALQTYGQNTATGFFKDYLGLLANQQGVGLTGAGAVAGVGTGYANSVSANNNNAANQAIQGYGNVANANTALYGNIAGGIQGVANAFGSSYGAKSTPPINDINVTNSGQYFRGY